MPGPSSTHAQAEREVGFRFYLSVPDDEELGIVIPRKPTLAVRLPVAYEDAPAFSLRQNYGLGHLGASRGGAADRLQVNHTHFGWRDLYQQSNPEFFACSTRTAAGTRHRGRHRGLLLTIRFVWIIPCSLLAGITVGTVASVLWPRH